MSDHTIRRPIALAVQCLVRVVRHVPFTLLFATALIVVGVASGSFVTPFATHELWDSVAYGLPAFQDGKFLTVITGTFFVAEPWMYALEFAGCIGIGLLEYHRGTLVALAYYVVGQLFGVFAAAGVLWLVSLTPSPWAQEQAALTDVGPSAGLIACVAGAIALWRQPWRLRALLLLLSVLSIAMLYWGTIADLEHLLAALLVLIGGRTLRWRKTTPREQRLIAYVLLLALGVTSFVAEVVPTRGPFGDTEPWGGTILLPLLDITLVIVIGHGLRTARRWAWWVGMIIASVNAMIGVVVLILVLAVEHLSLSEIADRDFTVPVATSVLWLMFLIYLWSVRSVFRRGRTPVLGQRPLPTPLQVRNALHAYGGGTLSWMATWRRMAYMRAGRAIVPYRLHAGVAIALAEPVGPRQDRDEAVAEFVAAAEGDGIVPCFFSANEAMLSAVPPSWRSLVVADDTIVDLPELAFSGKRWNSVRTSLNKAKREQVSFRMTHYRDESRAVQAQLKEISDAWVGEKDLPEMGFTLGTLTEAKDPEVHLAIAESADGRIEGFLSWLPVYGEGAIRGWTLDLMRRRDGGFSSVMEFLIGSSALWFKEAGYEFASLSGAPLAHDYPDDASVIASLSAQLSDALEPVYGFQSLHRFKAKFHPRYETLYLLYREEADLPRIGVALTRAFLPDATLRQFAGAGFELFRKRE